MSKVIWLLLIITVFSAVSEASDWRFIKPTGAEGNGFYIDMDNIKRVTKSKVRFWYTVARGPEEAKKDTGGKSYVEMDCINKRYRDVTYEREHKAQSYSGGGGSVEVTTESPIYWDNISPDSFQEAFYDTVCRKKK